MPQLCAMSVALLAQGEIVPMRGTTYSGWPCASISPGSAASSSAARRARSSPVSSRSDQTTWK